MPDELKPRCDKYKPKGPDLKENCANCLLWVGIQCKDHLILLSEYETSRKFKELNRLMGHDSFERGSGGIRQTRRG